MSFRVKYVFLVAFGDDGNYIGKHVKDTPRLLLTFRKCVVVFKSQHDFFGGVQQQQKENKET